MEIGEFRDRKRLLQLPLGDCLLERIPDGKNGEFKETCGMILREVAQAISPRASSLIVVGSRMGTTKDALLASHLFGMAACVMAHAETTNNR